MLACSQTTDETKHQALNGRCNCLNIEIKKKKGTNKERNRKKKTPRNRVVGGIFASHKVHPYAIWLDGKDTMERSGEWHLCTGQPNMILSPKCDVTSGGWCAQIIRTDSMMVSPYSWDWMAKQLRDDVVGGVAASPEMHSTVDPAP